MLLGLRRQAVDLQLAQVVTDGDVQQPDLAGQPGHGARPDPVTRAGVPRSFCNRARLSAALTVESTACRSVSSHCSGVATRSDSALDWRTACVLQGSARKSRGDDCSSDLDREDGADRRLHLPLAGGDDERYERGWSVLAHVGDREVRVRHGLCRRAASGRDRVRSVNWVELAPTLEGFEADDYAQTRGLVSGPDFSEVLRS